MPLGSECARTEKTVGPSGRLGCADWRHLQVTYMQSEISTARERAAVDTPKKQMVYRYGSLQQTLSPQAPSIDVNPPLPDHQTEADRS